MDKKINLEHTIRNIVSESLGAGVTTDKFKGTQKAFLQPAPQIKPKVGDAHPDGSAVTAKRGLAKINQSETMKEEEQLNERAPRPPKGYIPPKPKAPAGIGPGNKAAPEKTPWEKLTDIKRNDGFAAEIGKDVMPIVGTYRQYKRTGEAYGKTVDAFNKGNYWDAAKGALDTAGQGVLTGVSAVGDAITATGIGAAPVAAARAAVKGTPTAISSLASTIKGVVAGSKAEKTAAIVTKAPTTSAAAAKTVPAATAAEPPKVDTSIMGNLNNIKAKGQNLSQKDVNVGAASNANKPPQITEPARVEPVPSPKKTAKDNKPANDQEILDYKQQGNLKLKPEKKSADIPPAPDKNAALEKIFKKQPNLDAPANVNTRPKTPKDIGKDKPRLDEPANTNVKKASNDNVAKTDPAREAPAYKKAADVAPAPAADSALRKATDAAPVGAKKKETAKEAETAKKTEPVKKPGGGIVIPPFGLPGVGTFDVPSIGSGKTTDVGTYTHKAGKRLADRFAEEYNLQDAEEIKRKSRKAQIIRKIIDEQKKKKRDTSTVDLHPKLKNQEPDQN